MNDIPIPEDFSHKEVYTFFGLAAYQAQALEKGLVNLCTVLKASGADVTLAEVDALFSQHSRLTLGPLIKSAQKLSAPGLDAALKLLPTALEGRNFLNHHFFWEYAALWEELSDRKHMITKLIELTRSFQAADEAVYAACEPIIRKRGVTESVLERCRQELLAAARDVH